MTTRQRPPNILLIMADNHAADMLGCYGNEEVHTPHLDRLASEGLRFNNAFCPNAMCSPCRASLLTGRMPSQHGVHTWLDDRTMDEWPPGWNALEAFETLPESLRTHGYQTALIGKYHLGVPFEPQNGFEHWVTFPHGHTRSFYDNTIIDNGRQAIYPGHTVDCFTEKAIDYLQAYQAAGEKPFFLFLTYNAPYGHWPSISGPARNRFASLYENAPMNSVPREGLSPQAIARYELRKGYGGGGIDYSAHLRMPNDRVTLRNFYSQMSMVDDGVGRVLAALDEHGLARDTLVLYTCDHGFSLGHHGYWGHGQATWPANMHRPAFSIPLLVRHPGHIQPGTSDLLVSSVDLWATLLELAGVSALPEAGASPSRSLAPLWHGGTLDWPNEVFMEQEETRALRTERWLYMHRFAGSKRFPFVDELYDLRHDPDERRNLIAEPEHAGTIAELRARLEDFFGRYNDPHFDLWKGGALKSNSDKPWLWADAWGPTWTPVY